MKAILKVAFAVGSAASLSACAIQTRAYVDPQYQPDAQAAVQRLAQPIAVRVNARMQVNGSAPQANALLQQQLEQALLAGGVFAPSSDPAAALLDVTANDISDLDAAHHRGFHTGLTLGSSGSLIDDNYEFTIDYRRADSPAYQAVYKHAIHTALGKIAIPANATPATPAQAFQRVVQDVVVEFTRDVQRQGVVAPAAS